MPYPGYALIDILELFSFLSLRRGEYLIEYTVDHEELSVVFRSALCATLPILGSSNEHVLFSEYKTKLQDLASQNDEPLKTWRLHAFEENISFMLMFLQKAVIFVIYMRRCLFLVILAV